MSKRGLMLMLLLAACFAVNPAHADSDNSGSGNSGSGGGSDDGGSGGGSDNSGSGNSGSGGGDDSDDDDDRDEDDDKDDASDNNKRNSSRDQERALKAVKRGKIVSLSTLKHHLKNTAPGKILRVELKKWSGTYFYRVRILTSGNRIKSITINALSLKQEKL
jgi:hypothetical protein